MDSEALEAAFEQAAALFAPGEIDENDSEDAMPLWCLAATAVGMDQRKSAICNSRYGSNDFYKRIFSYDELNGSDVANDSRPVGPVPLYANIYLFWHESESARLSVCLNEGIFPNPPTDRRGRSLVTNEHRANCVARFSDLGCLYELYKAVSARMAENAIERGCSAGSARESSQYAPI